MKSHMPSKFMFTQIVAVTGGFLALGNDGRIYFGHFIQTHPAGLTVPKFQWRRIPPIDRAASLEYEVQPENTKEETELNLKKYNDAMTEAQGKPKQ